MSRRGGLKIRLGWPIRKEMLWFYTRSRAEQRTCETRLGPDGDGYELVVTDETGTSVERFVDVASLLARELELMGAWRAVGWHPAPARVASRGRPRNAETTASVSRLTEGPASPE